MRVVRIEEAASALPVLNDKRTPVLGFEREQTSIVIATSFCWVVHSSECHTLMFNASVISSISEVNNWLSLRALMLRWNIR